MSRRVVLMSFLTLAFLALPVSAGASSPVGATFPSDFPTPIDASLGVKVLGFGAKGSVVHTPVIFLHGNNDTSHPMECNELFGNIRNMAQYFHAQGYSLGELWGLSYQGAQCDLRLSHEPRAAEPHTAKANVPDLRAFVAAVLAYSGAQQVDLVGHSLGVTLSREWMRQDNAYSKVRSLVGVDGPEHGIINCSPSPLNYWGPTYQFTPNRPVCLEFGSDRTPLLSALNATDETPGTTRYMTIRNSDTSFVFFDKLDGSFPPVPAQDREGKPHDFSMSAQLQGATNVNVTGQGQYDNILLTAHLGIINSPQTWKLAFDFLAQASVRGPGGGAAGGSSSLAASGEPPLSAGGLVLILAGAALFRTLRTRRHPGSA